MTELTVRLDDALARWAADLASRRGITVEDLIQELLTQRLDGEMSYRDAQERFFAVVPRRLRSRPEQPLPSRDEAHERRRTR